MRAWALLLGGLIVWSIHFFSLYVIASIFLTSILSRVLTLLVTAACLTANGGAFWWALRDSRGDGGDEFWRWTRAIAALIAAISFLAVLWQGLPAIFA